MTATAKTLAAVIPVSDLLDGTVPASKADAEWSARVHGNRALSLRASLAELVDRPQGHDPRIAAKMVRELADCELAAELARQWAESL